MPPLPAINTFFAVSVTNVLRDLNGKRTHRHQRHFLIFVDFARFMSSCPPDDLNLGRLQHSSSEVVPCVGALTRISSGSWRLLEGALMYLEFGQGISRLLVYCHMRNGCVCSRCSEMMQFTCIVGSIVSWRSWGVCWAAD